MIGSFSKNCETSCSRGVTRCNLSHSIAKLLLLSLQLATQFFIARLVANMGCHTKKSSLELAMQRHCVASCRENCLVWYGLKLRQLIRWSCWTTNLRKIHKTHSWFFGRYIDDCLGTASCTHVDLERCINYVNYFHPDLNFTWEISETVCRPWIFRY